MSTLRRFIIILLVLVGIPTLAWSAGSTDPRALGYDGGTGIGSNSNPHNLSTQSGNTIEASSETRICIFCHTPHGGTEQTPLWSRPDPDTMGSFPTFNSARVIEGPVFGIDDPAIVATTLYNASQVYGEYPNGATKLCLSCHDGVTSIGTLADGTTITMTQDTITDTTKFWDPVGPAGMDFSQTHPVSFVYDGSVVTYLNGVKSGTYTLPTAGSKIRLDAQGRMQCTTCHDPHLDTNDGTYTLPFWQNAGVYVDETADYDQTCLECHNTVITNSMHNI